MIDSQLCDRHRGDEGTEFRNALIAKQKRARRHEGERREVFGVATGNSQLALHRASTGAHRRNTHTRTHEQARAIREYPRAIDAIARLASPAVRRATRFVLQSGSRARGDARFLSERYPLRALLAPIFPEPFSRRALGAREFHTRPIHRNSFQSRFFSRTTMLRGKKNRDPRRLPGYFFRVSSARKCTRR